MASVSDVSSSILASDGKELKTGILSLLRKKKTFLKKLEEHELCPLYWRLLYYGGSLYLLGYKKQQPGCKVNEKILIKGCSTDLTPPGKVAVSSHSNETFLCIQHPEGITFMKAETKRQRDKWREAISRVIKEPIYIPSGNSTISTLSDRSLTESDTGAARATRSFHATTDTPPVDVNAWRRINTAPTGHFQTLSHQSSIDSAPESASVLGRLQQDEYTRSREPVEQHCPGSSCASTLSRPRSLQNIYAEKAQYGGLGSCDEQPSITRTLMSNDVPDQKRFESRPRSLGHIFQNIGSGPMGMIQPLYAGDNSGPSYMPLQFDRNPSNSPDDVYVNQQVTKEYDDTVLNSEPVIKGPALPPRNSTKSNQSRKKPSKKKPAPQPPKQHSKPSLELRKNDVKTGENVVTRDEQELDSIEREKTVMLGEPSPEIYDTSLPTPNLNAERHATNTDSLEAYVKRFRSEQFESSISIEIQKSKLTRTAVKLVCVGQSICVAALPDSSLRSKLHVGDVLLKVNAQRIVSIDFCFDLFRTTDGDMVQLQVSRVPHGVMSHVTLSSNGGIDALGLRFDNSTHGNEVTAIDSRGLVAKSGSPSRPKCQAVNGGGMLVNWALIEINEKPVSLESTPEDVRRQLAQAGIELALVFIPIDMVHLLKEEECSEEIYEDLEIGMP